MFPKGLNSNTQWFYYINITLVCASFFICSFYYFHFASYPYSHSFLTFLNLMYIYQAFLIYLSTCKYRNIYTYTICYFMYVWKRSKSGFILNLILFLTVLNIYLFLNVSWLLRADLAPSGISFCSILFSLYQWEIIINEAYFLLIW